jgi:hypothetical protein
MTVVLAHFTPADAPGTLAILLLGVCIGGLLFSREMRSPLAAVVAALLATFATLGYIGDAEGWAGGTRMALDVFFLLGAALLVGLALRRN